NGGFSRSFTKASSPWAASSTWYPLISKAVRRPVRKSASSSTTRMYGQRRMGGPVRRSNDCATRTEGGVCLLASSPTLRIDGVSSPCYRDVQERTPSEGVKTHASQAEPTRPGGGDGEGPRRKLRGLGAPRRRASLGAGGAVHRAGLRSRDSRPQPALARKGPADRRALVSLERFRCAGGRGHLASDGAETGAGRGMAAGGRAPPPAGARDPALPRIRS